MGAKMAIMLNHHKRRKLLFPFLAINFWNSCLKKKSKSPYLYYTIGVRICHRYRVRTVPFSIFFTVPFFTASATVTVPFLCPMVRSAKRAEPLILTVRFLVFDREPYRTKMGTVIRLVLKSANRTLPNGGPLSVYYCANQPRCVPHQNWCGTDRDAATKFVRCKDKRCELGRFAFIIGDREPKLLRYGTRSLILNG